MILSASSFWFHHCHIFFCFLYIFKIMQKKKREGTALETLDEGEANVREAVENRRNYSEYDGKDNIFLCADSKNGKFSNDKANRNEDPIRTNEQVLTSTPSTKVVTTAEFDSTNMKASKKNNSSVTMKKATPKNDHKVKSCGMFMNVLL
jgi:hypothetical protein